MVGSHLFSPEGSKPKGFVYMVPYMSNMTFPAELYSKLTEFAKAHPTDKLDAKAMLFAVQLWVDITSHPARMAEEFTQNPNGIPEVSLAVFLLYYEAWLKVHEYLQCT